MTGLRILVLAVGALAICSGRAGAESASISGVVIDGATRRPVPHVRVEALHTPAAVISDAAGRFQLAALAPGSHTVRATANGYAVLTRGIDLERGGVTVELVLVRTSLRAHETVVVTARRDESSSFDAARSTATVSDAWLTERLPRSTPEALMEAAGVWVQKTNHGGGSPFIRGLVGNQVLVLIDGIRLNNSTFRLGPNQYLATIDPAQVSAIEVMRGSGSVLYGSDALGGVVNILTRRPQFSSEGASWLGAFTPKYVGERMEQSGRLDVEGRSARAAVVGGISFRRFGDLVAGGDLGLQSPRGMTRSAAMLKHCSALLPAAC